MLNRFAFVAGDSGAWRIRSMNTLAGASLDLADRLDVVTASSLAGRATATARWVLEGVVSNLRYATRAEVTGLKAVQQPLGRATASRAALIPIRKSAAWWEMTQDERRAVFEETSHHTAIGMEYLPAVSRQLFHARDIAEPFDFLTWFEYAPADADAFEALVERLRATLEWSFVEREIDIRLERI